MIGTAPAAGITVPRPVYRRYGFEYWQQLEDGRLLLGGFRDAGGQAEEGAPPRPEGIVQDRLEQFLRTDLGVHARITHRWAATVGYRRELLPFSGEVRPGVFALGGYNGTGNVMGPLLARRLADQVSVSVCAPCLRRSGPDSRRPAVRSLPGRPASGSRPCNNTR